jgi:hypothetical protein
MIEKDLVNKEALFNEVKGSLFEFLMAQKLAKLTQNELGFFQGLDENYRSLLSQQDRMIRQFYPQMLPFLSEMSEVSVKALVNYLGEIPHSPQLRGKFSDTSLVKDLFEADLILHTSSGVVPLSLKLNKKNSFVNTKSGGIKSFISHYFPFIPAQHQEHLSRLVDQEFTAMAHELHAFNDLHFKGDFELWKSMGKSELPGELSPPEREILKAFYARLAQELHHILSLGMAHWPQDFARSIPALMGFGHQQILQLICYHDFKHHTGPEVVIHGFQDISNYLDKIKISKFRQTASVEILLGPWNLQIRIKPMNKFTTTAIKINCSVKTQATC